jgi:hypothetical protein
MRRLGDHVFMVILLLLSMLGLTSCGALAAETQLAPIKIDRVDVQVGDLGTARTTPVKARVVGYYGACSRSVHEPVVSRRGSTIAVTIVVEYIVQKDSSCPAMIEPYDRTIELGSFGPGSYTLRVNDYSTTFTVPGEANGDVIFRPLLQEFVAFFGDQDPSTLLPGRIVVELKDGVDFHALDKDLQQIHGRDTNPAMPELSVRVIEVPVGIEQEAISVLRKNPNVKDVHQDHFTTAD